MPWVHSLPGSGGQIMGHMPWVHSLPGSGGQIMGRMPWVHSLPGSGGQIMGRMSWVHSLLGGGGQDTRGRWAAARMPWVLGALSSGGGGGGGVRGEGGQLFVGWCKMTPSTALLSDK